MSFAKTLTILQDVEKKLLEGSKANHQDRNSFFKKFKIVLMMELFEKGFKIHIKNFVKFIVFFIIGIITIWFIPHNEKEFFVNLQLMTMLAILWSFFPLPSTFCNYGIQKQDIVIVLNVFIEHHLKMNEVKKIKTVLDDFQLRTKQRLLALRGIVLLLWSLYSFIASKTIDFNNLHINQYAPLLGWIFAIAFFAYFIIEIYANGIWYVFKSIDFALIEYEDEETLFSKIP